MESQVEPQEVLQLGQLLDDGCRFYINGIVGLHRRSPGKSCTPPSDIANNHAGPSIEMCSSHIPRETPAWDSRNTSRHTISAHLWTRRKVSCNKPLGQLGEALYTGVPSGLLSYPA